MTDKSPEEQFYFDVMDKTTTDESHAMTDQIAAKYEKVLSECPQHQEFPTQCEDACRASLYGLLAAVYLVAKGKP